MILKPGLGIKFVQNSEKGKDQKCGAFDQSALLENK